MFARGFARIGHAAERQQEQSKHHVHTHTRARTHTHTHTHTHLQQEQAESKADVARGGQLLKRDLVRFELGLPFGADIDDDEI